MWCYQRDRQQQMGLYWSKKTVCLNFFHPKRVTKEKVKMQRAFDATMKRNRHKSIRWEKTSLSKVQNGKFNRMLVYKKVASVFGMDINQQCLNILNIQRYRRRSLFYTQLIIAHIQVVVHHLLFVYLCLFIIHQWTAHRRRRRSKRDRAETWSIVRCRQIT